MTTSRIGIGTFVASPNFRHPVPFAKELMTLDVMSAGRLRVALGPGTTGFDAPILGSAKLSARNRIDRLEEFVTLLDLLLGQSRTTWSGDWFTAVDAPIVPGPTQRPRPPFVIAANGPRGMRLALRRGEGWVTMGTAPFGSDVAHWWTGAADAARRFDAVAESAGGQPQGFRRCLDVGAGPGPASSVENVVDDLGRIADLGFTDAVIPWPRSEGVFAGPSDVLPRLADLLDGDGKLV